MSLKTVKKLYDAQDYRAVLEYFKNRTARNRDERNLIAMSLFYIGDTEKAVEVLRGLTIDEPNYWGYANNLGLIYLRKQDYSSALEMLKKALKLEHPLSEREAILLNIGSAYGEMGNLEDAFDVWKSIKGPKKIKAQSNIGYYLLMQGKFTHAKKVFGSLVRQDPTNIDLLRKFSQAGGSIDGELHSALVRVARGNCALKDRVEACFLLARLEDQKANYEKAEKLYLAANRLTLELIGNYNREKSVKLHRYLKYVEISTLAKSETIAQVKPLFIVGMPRSGTTLLERVVSMHSEVTTIGESTALSDAINSIKPKSGKNVLKRDLQKIRKSYFAAVASLGVKTQYVLDKMPHNFRFVEFIEKALPEAKIIHIKRDAVANGWSLFNTYFPDGAQHFSYSVDDISFYYLEYLDLVTTLATKYASRILYMKYESLIEDFNTNQRKIFNHLGLETANLNFSEFHKAHGIIRTASITSTRSKLQTDRNRKVKKFPNVYAQLGELKGF